MLDDEEKRHITSEAAYIQDFDQKPKNNHGSGRNSTKYSTKATAYKDNKDTSLLKATRDPILNQRRQKKRDLGPLIEYLDGDAGPKVQL